MALGNPTVSATILITGMLVFSGLGALVSERVLPIMRGFMPVLFVVVAAMLTGYALYLDRALEAIGACAYGERLALLLPLHRAAGVPDGLPDVGGDDDAGAARQGAHVHLGLGRQRLLLGDRRGGGAGAGDPASGSPRVIEVAALAYFLAWPAFGGVMSRRIA